jgi:hypothetical protein
MIRDLSRTAVDRSLRLLRLPADTVVGLLPNGDRGPRAAATLAIDRTDAAIRHTIGGLLRDTELRADALVRRAAADQRQRALKLQVDAEQTRKEADAKLNQEQRAVAERRAQAAAKRDERLDQVEQAEAEAEQRVEQATVVREEAIEERRAKRVAKAEKAAKVERLDVLEKETAALDEQEKALAASDEAQRLKRATARVKAERKADSR